MRRKGESSLLFASCMLGADKLNKSTVERTTWVFVVCDTGGGYLISLRDMETVDGHNVRYKKLRVFN